MISILPRKVSFDFQVPSATVRSHQRLYAPLDTLSKRHMYPICTKARKSRSCCKFVVLDWLGKVCICRLRSIKTLHVSSAHFQNAQQKYASSREKVYSDTASYMYVIVYEVTVIL
jgi:hypothetical protein